MKFTPLMSLLSLMLTIGAQADITLYNTTKDVPYSLF
jgi:hypothetical protein